MTDNVRELVGYFRVKADNERAYAEQVEGVEAAAFRKNADDYDRDGDLIESMAAALRSAPKIPDDGISYDDRMGMSRELQEWTAGPLAEALEKMGEKDA